MRIVRCRHAARGGTGDDWHGDDIIISDIQARDKVEFVPSLSLYC